MSQVPDLPGVLVHSDHESYLKGFVARLSHMGREKFPGSQPVSFGIKDLEKLETQDYWVCEKSDGVRVLFLVHTDLDSVQTIYIIDRHNSYRQLDGLFFPHHENPVHPLKTTLVDGELVLDVDPRTKHETLRFLAFDCLAVDGQDVMSRSLDKRYGRLTEWFYKPYAKMMRDHPYMAQTQPFEICVKEISFSYHVDKVFAVDIPALQHGNDGLVYTCVSAPYSPGGTDPNILKWKPPSDNSIDFKLVLRFPPSPSDPNRPDFCAKPVFALHVWCGDERGVPKYEEYDSMFVSDDEWETMKRTGEQFDDRIVEVHWDTNLSRWRMMRFRDDKPNGNHRSVVENIIQTIVDGVEKTTLIARSNAIRSAWKARHGQSSSTQSAPIGRPPPARHYTLPESNLRYGPLATSRWSKVAGPTMVAGMKR